MGIREILLGDQRKWNRGGKRPKMLSADLRVCISERMEKSINKLVDKGIFPNKSEFVRYVIRNHLDEMRRW